MPLHVADVRANLNENIRHAARIIGKSEARLKVFRAIYAGKKQVKTVPDLMKATRLSHVRVLQEAGKLEGNGIVEKVRKDGRTAYKKDKTYTHHKKAIIDLCESPSKRTKYPTKQEPRLQGQTTIRIKVSRTSAPLEVTIDEIDAFKQVRSVQLTSTPAWLHGLREERIKRFLKRVVGETNEFKDWGGERNDLYTNRLLFRGARRTAAFALKGRATTGSLTPKKMGANGDQIGRLAASEADVFLVVYHGKVEQSIPEQLRAYGVARSMSGRRVFYCVIGGQDLARLIQAYRTEFDKTV